MTLNNQPLKIDIVIVNYQKSRDTINCAESIRKSLYPIRKIFIIDNTEDKDVFLENNFTAEPMIKYIKTSRNLGFAGGNNLGITESLKDAPDYILLLNNDVIVNKDFLNKLVAGTLAESADITTGKIYYYDRPDIIWGAGGWIDWKRGMGMLYGIGQKDVGQFDKNKGVSFISGCMMLIKCGVFGKIGMFDEKYFMYYEDVDFCLRASNAGFKMAYIPGSIIWHKVGAINPNKTPFYFYYFMRNSIFVIRKFATFRQKIWYSIYSAIYYSLKFLHVFLRDSRYIPSFFFALRDGLSGNEGAKDYGFLR